MAQSIITVPADGIQSAFASTIDLITKPLGSKVLAFSDEWFASASNLTTSTPPIRKPGYFVHTGAWYDGWETRRHNPAAFDWVVIRLGVASGKVLGIEIDTAHFNGNHAPEIAVEACFSPGDDGPATSDFNGWETLLPKQECGPSRRQAWKLGSLTEKAYTHVRLQMFPDGGIARFRLYGVAVPVFPEDINAKFDLAGTVNGGLAVSCSDEHFGRKENLLFPARGVDMGDGWETKRTRGEHIDWTIVKLGAKGNIDEVVIDTAHFRGNFPKEVQVFAANTEGEADLKADSSQWVEILTPQKMGPDKEHEFSSSQLQNVQGQTYTHAKLVMIPDGGISRFRVIGRRAS